MVETGFSYNHPVWRTTEMSENPNDNNGGRQEGEPPKRDLTELMFRLAEIRKSVPDADDTGRKLLKNAIVLAFFLAMLVLMPMLFSGSCNPAG